MENYDLERFVSAQEYVYDVALSEIRQGRKSGHWIWYVFPQMKGLGQSFNSEFYGITDLAEAKAYLKHPVLGRRLTEITEALLSLETNDPYTVMGYIDAMKLCSCMTLFAAADDDGNIFEAVLDKFFHGRRDNITLRMIGK